MMSDFMTAFYAVFMGWCFGFISFAFIDIFTSMKRAKKEQARHEAEMARLKIYHSLGRGR